MDKRRQRLAEVLQLVPVVTLASSFIVSGAVDLSRAGPLFGVAALLTLPITAVVVKWRRPLNPILTGTALWLWVGAAAFLVPIDPLAQLLAETQATGLFVAALAVGAVSFTTPRGYIGADHDDPAWIKKTSFGLLLLTVLITAWAYVYRHDIRLGGGLPFIVLNVVRRVVIARFA